MPSNPKLLLRWLVLCGVALLTLGVSTAAFASDIHVDVHTIYATDGEPAVDSKLASLKDELLSGFPGYSSFTLLRKDTLEIPAGENRSMELPDQEKSVLEIGNQGRTQKEDLLKLQVGLKGKIAAEVKASPGSTFFQAGLLYKDGILILAIQANRVPK